MVDYFEQNKKMKETVSYIEMLSVCSIEVLLEKLAAGWKLTPPNPEPVSLEKLCEDVSEDDSPKKKLIIQYDAILSKRDLAYVRDSIRKQLEEDNYVVLDGRFKVYEVDAVKVGECMLCDFNRTFR